MDKYEYINLITYRRSGVPVATPVWFRVVGTHIYVQTGQDTGKLKRIAHTTHVTLWVSDARGGQRGPHLEATAHIITDPAKQEFADTVIQQKYGAKRTIFMQQIGMTRERMVYLEIDPLSPPTGETPIMSTIGEPPFGILEGQQFINLVTFRKDGTPVNTTVWFAQAGDKLYAQTGVNAGKVKRIRNNPQIIIGPSDMRGTPLGPTMPATARVLSDEPERQIAETTLDRKYGEQRREMMSRSANTDRDYIEITAK